MKSRRICLLFLVSTLRRSGPTRQLLNIMRHLDPNRFNAVILTLSPEPVESMASEFSDCPVRLRTLGLSRWRAFIKLDWLLAVERVLVRKVDRSLVVHAQGFRADGIAAKYLGQASCLSTIRNYPFDDYPLKYGRLRGHWMAVKHLRSLRRIPYVVACSATISGLVEPHGVETAVICNGVETDELTPATDSTRRRLRAKFGFDDNVRLIVSAGTLGTRKDPLTVLRAFGMSGKPNWRLVLIGSGPLHDQCQTYAGVDARVSLTGEISNVADYLRCGDVFVSASRSEGLPNSVLEAMACGLGIVLSDIPAHREILGLAPSIGGLFPVGDAATLSQALDRMLNGDLCEAGRQARAAAESYFSSRAMSCAYQAIYAALARGHRLPY